MHISIIIPVYNSSESLSELAERIDAVFIQRPTDSYELIFIDDCSSNPSTWPILKKLAAERDPVRVIQLTRNFGQQAATLCGLRESEGNYVITMDDDLQHLPEDIPALLQLSDFDIVIGQFRKKQHSLFKRSASKIKGYFDRIILGKPKGMQLGSYRMLSRTVVDGMLSIKTPNPFIPALMFHVSKNAIGVEVRHGRRKYGTSDYTLMKLLKMFSNLLINNSALTLRIVGHLGIFFAAISMLGACNVTYRKLVHGIAVVGYASIMVTLLLIGGILLFSVGIAGEYLIRIIESAESKPTYFVRQRYGFPADKPKCDSGASPLP